MLSVENGVRLLKRIVRPSVMAYVNSDVCRVLRMVYFYLLKIKMHVHKFTSIKESGTYTINCYGGGEAGPFSETSVVFGKHVP